MTVLLNVRDAACIAQKLAQHRESDLPDWSDYNEDGTINVRDAAAIAVYLVNQSSADVNDKIQNGDIDSKTWKAPKKEDYNLKVFDGLKKYVNDYIEYYAYVEYGIKEPSVQRHLRCMGRIWLECSSRLCSKYRQLYGKS